MAEPVIPELSMEARLQYEILRAEIRATGDPERLRQKALMLIDMLEVQRRTTYCLLRQNGTRPARPSLPSLP
jgi:hypothetical protein